jgi:hypothetical protein
VSVTRSKVAFRRRAVLTIHPLYTPVVKTSLK